MKYPALTIPVQITAEEHARIAAFCEKVRITVAKYVTFAGIGVDVDDYEKDPTLRAGLLEDIAKRFGGAVPVVHAPAVPVHTVSLEFSELAFAMLEVLRVHDEHATVADLIRHELAGSAACLFESVRQPQVADTFAAPGEEGREG